MMTMMTTHFSKVKEQRRYKGFKIWGVGEEIKIFGQNIHQ